MSVGIPVAHFVEKLNACAVNPEDTDNQLKADAILLYVSRIFLVYFQSRLVVPLIAEFDIQLCILRHRVSHSGLTLVCALYGAVTLRYISRTHIRINSLMRSLCRLNFHCDP